MDNAVLQYPNPDKKFKVTTDACGYGIAAVLSQEQEGADRPIAFASRTLNDGERKWDTHDKEALSIVFAMEQFRHWLLGKRFTLVTDHKAHLWIKSKKDPSARVTRWRLKLGEFEYDVEYKPGRENINADVLSRNPI